MPKDIEPGMGWSLDHKEHLLCPGMNIDAVVWGFEHHYLDVELGDKPTRIKISGRMVIRWFKNAKKHAGLYTPGLWYRVYADAPEYMVITGQTMACDWR